MKRPPSLPGAAEALAKVRAICLELLGVSEKTAWGAPTFRAGGRMFAMFVDNHHGDGRLALWCDAPPGLQAAMLADDARHFFVPPYMGPKGWIGVRLDRGLGWKKVEAILRQARSGAPVTAGRAGPSLV